MDEYISVFDLKNVFTEVYGKESPIAKGWIDWVETKAKKADVEPVRHGHWCFTDKISENCIKYKCSYCNRFVTDGAEKNPSDRFPYCHCGAKMDEADNGYYNR